MSERPYGIEAVFEDNSGNWFSLTQPRGRPRAAARVRYHGAVGSVAWATWLWLAATWRVDGDATECPGDGSEAAPFCTLQDAFDADLSGGGEIVVRDAATVYAGGEVTNVDGTAGAPIVLRPEDGHAPRIGGMVELTSSSHWIVRGLTFDAQGGQPGHTAIAVGTGAEIVEGIVVENNTIVGWGGPLVTALEDGISGGVISIFSYPGVEPRAMLEPIVRGNRIVGGRGKGIFVLNAVGGTIEGNEIAELTCQMETNGPGMTGIHVGDTDGAVVARNRIRDLDVSACSLGGADPRVTGVWLQDASDTEVRHNLVQRVGGEAQAGAGVNLIHSADDCRIHHNVVVDADQCGLCNGVLGSNGGDRARFVANTVIGGRGSGLELLGGEDTEFLGNVVVGAAGAQVRILRTAEIGFEGGVSTWVFDDNLYMPAPGEDNIGRFEYSSAVDFASWSSECGCDAGTVVADPMLPAGGGENFTAAAGSPVVDGGVALPEVEAWNGDGVDLGAVEAPLLVSASIATADPDTIHVVLQSETSPLRHDPGCSGFTIAIDGDPVDAVSCELDGDAIAVRLAEPAHAGDEVVLAYAGSSISNSDAIGGVVHGMLQPFEMEVDNGSQEMPPAESGDDDSDGSSGEPTTTTDPSDASASGSGSGSATSEAETDGAGASYPGVEGCTCSSRSRGWPLWFVLPFALRRRPRS